MVLQANKQSVDYKIMVHVNKRPSKDNNTIRHQEDTATNGMPNDDKATLSLLFFELACWILSLLLASMV
jgi:hypothetical protein